MSYTHQDFVRDLEEDIKNARNNTRQKQKLRELMAKYGYTKEEIENNSTMADWMEFKLANGDQLLEVVRQEFLNNNHPAAAPDIERKEEKEEKQTPIEEEEDEDEDEDEDEEEEEEIEEKKKREEINENKNLIPNLLKSNISLDKNRRLYQDILNTAKEDKMQIKRVMGDQLSDNKQQNEKHTEKQELLLKNIKEYLSSTEGENMIEHIYLDTKGNITIGKGANVDDEKTFMALNLEINGRPATVDEKREAYNKFQIMKQKGQYGKYWRADKYKNISTLRISKKTADEMMNKHLLSDLKELQNEVPNFNTLPLELQEVLLDIKYNTGNVNRKNWPLLHQAIKDKNLPEIARQIHRKDVSQERNKWARDKILSIKNWNK